VSTGYDVSRYFDPLFMRKTEALWLEYAYQLSKSGVAIRP
jgi:hypothetical protein